MIDQAPKTTGTDYYLIDALLTPEEREVRDRVRSFCDPEVAPIMNDYWERAEIISMQLLALRLSQLAASGKMTAGMASLAKLNNARKARQVVADARDILGGNGILLEYGVARHFADMEAVFTYEGTEHVQSLIVGRDITGENAFS